MAAYDRILLKLSGEAFGGGAVGRAEVDQQHADPAVGNVRMIGRLRHVGPRRR